MLVEFHVVYFCDGSRVFGTTDDGRVMGIPMVAKRRTRLPAVRRQSTHVKTGFR